MSKKKHNCENCAKSVKELVDWKNMAVCAKCADKFIKEKSYGNG